MFNGHTSGVPTFRTKVLYIPQRPSLLPLTPRDFVSAVMSFSAQKRQNREAGFTSGGPPGAWMDRFLEVGSRFGVDPILWDRNWAELSGGEGQRVMMAIGVALGTAEVLLLDGQSLLITIVTFPFPN
jgi:ABC-type iron transport system FetAB ATPase subunit